MIRRQLRTTALLLFIATGLIVAGLYVRSIGKTTPVAVDQAITGDLSPISQQVTAAEQRYTVRGEGEVATLRDAADGGVKQKVELAIYGLLEEDAMRTLLDDLTGNGVSATFFVTGSDASKNPKSLALARDTGFGIGVAYLSSSSGVSAVSGKRAVSDLFLSGAAIQAAVGVWPERLLSLARPDEELLAAAYACSIRVVLVPSKVIIPAEIGTEDHARAVVASAARGTILCLRLDGAAAEGTDFNPFLSALADTDIESVAGRVLAGEYDEAEPLRRAYTAEPAVAFTFSGMGNQAELGSVLDALKAVNARVTFFITRDEVARYPDQIRQVLAAGHELGISAQAARFSTASKMLMDLLYARDEIQATFSYTGPLVVRPSYGGVTDALRKACGAGGFKLITSMINAVRTDDIRRTDAAEILPLAFPEINGVLQRGEIVHFQMKQYQRSDRVLGDLIRLVVAQRSIYPVKPIGELLGNEEFTYTYPLPEDKILPSVKDAIHTGQLTGSPMMAIASRYIGIDWVSSPAFLPGFTTDEIKRLDKTGIVKNDKNMVFLTFDDWGSDDTITAILDVLKAHNARATFFVKTQFVEYNPNLLRAIAIGGHTIGDHTHLHLPLATDTGTGKNFTELTEDEVETLKKDLVTSYGVLQSIVGDVVVDGRPALSRLFRPPTLAVSKSGLETVFDCGYTYSICGTYTTQDYKATSASKLAATMKKYTKSGAVLVMHMSDTSVYTAEALDIYLSEMELLAPDKQYKFVGLGEVLN